ncbi:OB-fold protein [Aquimarina sp. 2304DJ70-9]|uniref:OB-fold protein n=1 Tax=Aquimarina penaris TaxID=3231044 RepID=UPI003462DAF7
MNRNNKIVTFLFCLLLVAGLYFYYGFYNRTYVDINHAATEIKISSGELTSTYILNEESANSIYRGKVIEVEGIVKEISFLNNRNTVLLHGDDKYSSVLCDMQSDQIEEVKKLKRGQKIKIKGICKGFLKDAILLNCMLINTQINE